MNSKNLTTMVACFCVATDFFGIHPAFGASTQVQCLAAARMELDNIRDQIRSIDSEADTSNGVSRTGFVVPGECSRLLALINRTLIPTVPPREADRAERKACLELRSAKIGKFCECAAAGVVSGNDNATIDAVLTARKRLDTLRSKISKFSIGNPFIREYVENVSAIESCWSQKTLVILNDLSDRIENNLIAGDVPSVTTMNAGAPSISPMHGGPPSISPMNGGGPPASGISGISGISGGSVPDRSPVTSPPPSSAPISGPASSPSGGGDYRTGGAGTNVTRDVLDFTTAYNRSKAQLDAVTRSAPTPHARPSPPPPTSHPSRPPTPHPHSQSGISGGRH